MARKLESMVVAGFLGLASLLPSKVDAGSVNVWNNSGSPTVDSSGMYLRHSSSGSLGYDSGDHASTGSPPGLNNSWLTASTELIYMANTYNLDIDNRPSTGVNSMSSYSVNLGVGGNPVTSSGNYLQFRLADAANEPETGYSWVLTLYNGALFSDGSSTKSGTWNLSDGTVNLPTYNLTNVSGNYGRWDLTPIPEPGTMGLIGAGLLAMGLRMRFGKKR